MEPTELPAEVDDDRGPAVVQEMESLENDPLDAALPQGSESAEPDLEPDAMVVPDSADAAPDSAVPFVPLTVDNPSFERGGGLPGDVLLVSLVETLLPLPPVTWALTTLPNWYACVPLSVSSDSYEGDAGVGGHDYVSFVTNGTTVRQALREPMKEDRHYAFALDVLSRSEGRENLFVELRGALQQCGEGVVLGRSPVLRDDPGWRSTCVSFTASEPYSHLLLGPGWLGAAPSAGARLMIDNLRQVERCDP